MKLYGLFGKGSGKLGSSVFAISSGEQIVREYNPVVENPNTPAQVEQRAKFKLLSQIAASLASIIVIAKQGLVSARNRFIGLNIGKATYADGTASIQVQDINITGGSMKLPLPSFTKGESGTGTVKLAYAADASIDSVIYAIVRANDDNQLNVVGSQVVSVPGEGRTFDANLTGLPQAGYIFAYGVKGDLAAALAKYSDYDADPADVVATLVAERNTKAETLGFTASVATPLE